LDIVNAIKSAVDANKYASLHYNYAWLLFKRQVSGTGDGSEYLEDNNSQNDSYYDDDPPGSEEENIKDKNANKVMPMFAALEQRQFELARALCVPLEYAPEEYRRNYSSLTKEEINILN